MMPYVYSNNGLSVHTVSGGVALIAPLASNIGTGALSPVTVSASAALGAYAISFTSPIAYSVSGPGGTSIDTGTVGQPLSAGGLSFTIEAGSVAFQTGAATETEAEKPEVPAVPPDGFTIDVLELPYVVAAGEVLFPAQATETELDAAFPGRAAAVLAASLGPSARGALTASDLTVLRCVENGITVPAAWATYRKALRAIVDNPASATVLPTAPAYPSGT
jgi:hypothetical protein